MGSTLSQSSSIRPINIVIVHIYNQYTTIIILLPVATFVEGHSRVWDGMWFMCTTLFCSATSCDFLVTRRAWLRFGRLAMCTSHGTCRLPDEGSTTLKRVSVSCARCTTHCCKETHNPLYTVTYCIIYMKIYIYIVFFLEDHQHVVVVFLLKRLWVSPLVHGPVTAPASHVTVAVSHGQAAWTAWRSSPWSLV